MNTLPSLRRTGALRLLAALVALATLAPLLPANSTLAATQAPSDGFADANIRALWLRSDAPVAAGKVQRTWLWGPGPFFSTYEPMDGTPTGNRLVQYFDKGRLEINDPGADRSTQWFATSGLLVKEMVQGAIQVGTDANSVEQRQPVAIPVAGDDVGAGSAPTYGAFAALMAPQPDATGRAVTEIAGQNGALTPLAAPPVAVTLAHYEPGAGHNIANVFWDFMNSRGPVQQSGVLRDGQLFDWVYLMGLPLTDPYWVQANIAGKPTTLLVQLFERRVLTYNPDNAAGWQVEMGNVGRHYYAWRYADLLTDRKDAADRTRYNVEVQVTANRSLLVTEAVHYVNTTAAQRTLNGVLLRTVYHHWSGVFTLSGASVGDQAVQARWRDEINLEVPLAQNLVPGAAVDFKLSFTIKPRNFGGRHGYDPNNDILTLGDWLPTVAPYENGGWAQFPYGVIGDEGNSDFANYHVGFSTASAMVIGGTGDIAEHQARRWSYDAPGVRDVTYVLSSNFMDPYAESGLTRQVGNTTVRGFFLRANRAYAGGLLDLAAASIGWLNRQLGAYPYPSFIVGEMGYPTDKQWDYSQEYPQAYLLPTQRVAAALTPGTSRWITPIHEVAHQWFYGLVGDNQLVEPWLDEAFATYMSYRGGAAMRPDLRQTIWDNLAGASAAWPVGASLFAGYNGDETAYFRATYNNGLRFLDEIYRAMGADAFWAAMRDYVATYSGRRARTQDLVATWRAHTKANLDPILQKYLAYY